MHQSSVSWRTMIGMTITLCVLLISGNAGLTATLTGWWQFNEGTGSTVADASGNGSTAAITGATWTTDAYGGYALYFDGINDKVIIPDGAWNSAAPISIACWYKHDSATGNQSILNHCFTGANAGAYTLTRNGTFSLYDNTSTLRNAATSPVANDWTYVVLTISTAKMYAYENGKLKSTTNISGFSKRAGALYLGASDEASPLWFNGWIDDLRIYKGTLTGDEVRGLGAAPVNVKYALRLI